MEALLNRIADYLQAQSWQIAAVVFVMAAISWLLRRRSAHVRYLLWLVVLAKCLVPPLVNVPVAVLPEPEQHAYEPVFSPTPAPVEIPAVTAPVPMAPVRAPQPTVAPRPHFSLRQCLAVVWLLGVVLFALVAAVKIARTIVWLRQQRRPLPDDLQRQIHRLLASLGQRKSPRIWLIEDMGQPFVWGFIRGDIYLPLGFAQMRGDEHDRSILSHELGHVQRFDAAINSLQIIAQAIFWFHPLVWWANRRIRQEREKCCDEIALAQTGGKAQAYCHALVEILSSAEPSARAVPSLAIAGPAKNIEERMKTMLRPGKKFYQRPSIVAAIAVMLIALPAVSTALVLTVRAERTGIDELPTEMSEIAERDVIEGHVTDPNGAPLAGALVRIDRVADTYYPPEITETDEQGYYRLDVPDWPYRIMTQWQEVFPSGQGNQRQSMKIDQIFEGPRTVDFRYSAFPREDTTLRGRITDNEGNPVPEFKVWLIEQEYRQNANGRDLCQFDCAREFASDDGFFEVTGPPAGEYHLTIMPMSRRYESAGTSVTLSRGTATQCAIQLNTRKTFYGRVLFEDGSPALLPGVKTHIAMATDSSGSLMTLGYPNEEGIFEIYLSDSEIQQIEAQTGELWILLKDYRRGMFPLEELTDRREGVRTVTIVRPAVDSEISLVGKPLPSLGELGIDIPSGQIEGKSVLICFFGAEQRPSRNCLIELNRRVQELTQKGIATFATEAIGIEPAALDAWIEANAITIPVGRIETNPEQARENWGVQSLPWMILTNEQHVVIAQAGTWTDLEEGFVDSEDRR